MPRTPVRDLLKICQSNESDEVMQARSADHEERPRNQEVETAWIRYAYAFEERARLMATSPPSLISEYAEMEEVRMRTLAKKNLNCNDLLLAYFEAYDADQREAFGIGVDHGSTPRNL